MNPTLQLTVTTIHMPAPSATIKSAGERKSLSGDETNSHLILKEAFLRRTAYKNTPINISETFFDDSDLSSDYYLVVVYDSASGTPLLSARYCFDKPFITKCLRGERTDQPLRELEINTEAYPAGELFLADRLSGNIASSIYRGHRDVIFNLFYREVLEHNKQASLILMARKEKKDKLLNKYLRLGFNIVGTTFHKGREHWIVLCDLKNAKLPC